LLLTKTGVEAKKRIRGRFSLLHIFDLPGDFGHVRESLSGSREGTDEDLSRDTHFEDKIKVCCRNLTIFEMLIEADGCGFRRSYCG
jgi:hypothetical protein